MPYKFKSKFSDISEHEFGALSKGKQCELLREMEQERLEMSQVPLKFFTPHKVQKLFFESPSKNKWLFGGNRSGKTTAGAIDVVSECEMFPDRHWWAITDDMATSRDIQQKEIWFWATKSKLTDDTFYDVKLGFRHNMCRWKNGSIIQFKSYEQPRKKFQGIDLDGVWYDEEPPSDIHVECKMRLLDREGRFIGTMTPVEGMTWVYDQVFEKNGKFGIECLVASVWDNLIENGGGLTRTQIERALEDVDEDERTAREHGNFIKKSGLIYKDWKDQEPYICEPIDIMEPEYEFNTFLVGIDPHPALPTALMFIMIDKGGQVYIFEESYDDGLINEQVKIIKNKMKDRIISRTFIDWSANERDIKTGLTTTESFTNEGREVGLWISPEAAPKSGGSVKQSIRQVKKLLTINPDTNKPKVQICKNCLRTRWEMRRYQYMKNRKPDDRDMKEMPRKKDDHLMDLLRYYALLNANYIEREYLEQEEEYSPTFDSVGY